MTIEMLDLPTHAARVLAGECVESVEDLCALQVSDVLNFNRCGTSTLRLIGRACLRVGVMPSWLPGIAKLFAYQPCEESMIEYAPLSGPYAVNERHMLEAAIVQLGPIRWTVTLESAGIMLWRSRRGYRAVEEEI